jgi:hypothetical protein
VTISVLDGANRAATTHLTLNSTDPAPAASAAGNGTPASAMTGSGGGGGALQYWVLLCLGVLVALKIERQLQHA